MSKRVVLISATIGTMHHLQIKAKIADQRCVLYIRIYIYNIIYNYYYI